MESMTGYAYTEKSTDLFSYSIEIKSLNSRYLEIFINLPRVLRKEENRFNEILKEKFTRGKIELTVDIFNWAGKKSLSLNSDALITYYQELLGIHKKLKIEEPLKFESLLLLDGITHKNQSALSERHYAAIIRSLNSAISRTLEMRRKEGISTKNDIINSLSEISLSVDRIKTISNSLKKEKIKKFKDKINSIFSKEFDKNRLYSEIALMLEKLDINEEIVRIRDHLKKFRSLLKSKDHIGKKLDFLSQELFREINTIASKSSSSEISHNVVNVKDNIDKIREQCRNVM